MSDNQFTGFGFGHRALLRVDKGSVAELAHKRLDEIIDWVTAGAGGGDFTITDVDSGRSYRLTFCDFTGQAKCGHCGGTGTEGSNFHEPDLDVQAGRN